MVTLESLFAALGRRGTMKAAELATALGVSQPTVSRLLAAAGTRVCRMGRARATAYALTREPAGLGGTRVPVFRVDEAGRVNEHAALTVLGMQDRYWLERPDGRCELVQGLPTFANDLSPQGYLGRSFPDRHPDLGLPRRISDWNDDHRLVAIARRGEDGVGDIIVGSESLDRFLASKAVEATHEDYPRLARESALGQPGSSAAGEQPKFAACVGGRHLLVKFAAGDGEAGQRGRDLLACEALALDVVRRAGIAAAETTCIDIAGARYLESARFDRIGERGRRGVVSLTALNDQHLGAGYSWLATAAVLREERCGDISDEDCRRMAWLDTYGGLIANTDRHLGNLSFLSDEETGRWRLRLAPVYDMLPMLFAPVGTSVVERPFVPPGPTSETFALWPDAARWAALFWGEAAQLATVSDGFRRVCEACGATVDEQRRRHGT